MVRSCIGLSGIVALLLAFPVTAQQKVLRVCAEPNNLPYSNDRQQGFENEIANLIARELGAKVQYDWWAERRGFARKTLDKGRCDAVIGLPVGMPGVLLTRPYYRSTYVFVSRKDRHLDIRSFDDPRLKNLRIGVHILGEDFAPPGDALQRRNLGRNLVPYSAYGDYSRPNPPARLVEAVAKGEVDVAVVWGPFAGYFGSRQSVPLTITPVSAHDDRPWLPMTYSMAIAVARGNVALRDRMQSILDRNRSAVESILRKYGVPTVPVVANEREASR